MSSVAVEPSWHLAVEKLKPHVVRIATPRGFGTGFLMSHGQTSGLCGIATAAHVVNAAHYWEEPIRIDHESSGTSTLLRRDSRAIFQDETRDTAAILMDKGEFPFPEEVLPLIPEGLTLKVGNEVGWLGYPAVHGASTCFFAGRVSAWDEQTRAYLVDGVAINGVSGGPAIHLGEEQEPIVVMGVVSAYMPNRATGEVLPGLSVIRDVSHLHELAPRFATVEEAQTDESEPEEPKAKGDRDYADETYWQS